MSHITYYKQTNALKKKEKVENLMETASQVWIKKMVVINPEKYEPNLGDLGMQRALRKLHDEIFDVLKVYEEKADQERYTIVCFCLA